jgi:hypothetical protein
MEPGELDDARKIDCLTMVNGTRSRVVQGSASDLAEQLEIQGE